MEKPKIIQRKPLVFTMEEGKTYAWCACGLSKKESGALCDGSHKDTSFRPHIFKFEDSKKLALCMCKHTQNPPVCDGSHETL